jgi:plastocyanin
MRSLISGLLLSLLAVSGLGLAPSKAEAQLLPWRRARYYYYQPAVSYSAPAASASAVSYYYPATVAHYHAAPSYSLPAPSHDAPAPGSSSFSAYGWAPAPSAASSGTFTSNYHQPGAAGPTVNIRVQELGFEPPAMNIFAGTTVVWHNESSTPHTVTSDAGLFDSLQIPAGGSFHYTFNQPGTYLYHCALHPQMRATIVVQ